MPDLIDSAAGEMQQASNQLTRAGVRTGMTVAAGTTRVTARLGARAVGGVVQGFLALLETVRQATGSKPGEGEVRLREFTRIADGKREVLPIKDVEVARQLSRELRRHGVTYAVERHADGSRTFHVQGRDAALIEHALTVASTRVDERITRSRDRAGVNVEGPDASLSQDAGTRVLDLTNEQATTLAETLRGTEQAPQTQLAETITRDHAVTLTEENVHAVDAALQSGGETPAHMADVAAAVDEEKAALGVSGADRDAMQQEATLTTTGHDASPQQAVENPYVPSAQTAAAPVAEERPAPEQVRTERHEDAALVTEPADRKPELEQPTGRGLLQAWDRDISPREATREKVAKRIDVKVGEMKQQQKSETRPSGRTSPRVQGDEPRTPNTRSK